MIADDLFAGAGGWDLAAARLGIHARGVENMKEARATRDAAGLTTIHDDVWTFQPDGNAEGLIASPPCQTFSAAGKGSGRKALDDVLRGIRQHYWSSLDHLRFLGEEVGDNRTSLVLTPLHFAMTGGYDWLAWEQVPTVLPVWEACADLLRKHGWSVWTGLLQAEMYGVPQTRKRAFLLARRNRHVEPPTPTHSRYYSRTPDKLDVGVQKWVSMAEGIGWGLVQRPSYTVCGVSSNAVGDSEWGGASVRKALREAADSGDADVWASPSGVTGPVHRPLTHPAATVTGKGNYYMYERDAWREHGWGLTDRPSPTITGGGVEAGGAEPIAKLARYTTRPDWKPRRNRAGNVRVEVFEAGLLQGFPSDYPWQGTQGKQYLQAGNAVPPGLALHALAAAAGVDAQEVAA